MKWLIITNVVVFLVDFLGGSWIHVTLRTLFSLYFAGAVAASSSGSCSPTCSCTADRPPAVQHADPLVLRKPARAGLGHAPFPEILLLLRDRGRCLRPGGEHGWARGIPTIGASGAIFGVLVAFGVLYPNQTVLMNFLFPIKAKYMVMIYAAIELIMTMAPDNPASAPSRTSAGWRSGTST